MIDVFDFFSGCGGTSLGFQNHGFNIVGGLDFDKDCANTFKKNFPKASFFEGDIRKIEPQVLSNLISHNRKTPLLFCGCAPCQPFTKQRRYLDKNDTRRTLLSEFERFVEFWKPEFIFLENVPGLQKIEKSGPAFGKFTNKLSKLGYIFDTEIILASDLGVPQLRKRFILVAAFKGYNISPISTVVDKYKNQIVTVKEAIEDLPPLKAGETHPIIPNHSAAKLSSKNLERIKNTPEGGDRRDWVEHLKAGCHINYKGHTDVYGRMRWNAPSSTLTTKCISYSNGRFGHPVQNRAISVREAARLQTFPDNFVFSGTLISCARQVGNAVPPLMAQRISETFLVNREKYA